MLKYGIMGGTFDPIHYGHLVIANEVMFEFSLNRIYFIPTGQPPHKSSDGITSPEHRYMMTQLATMSHPCFDVSDYEVTKKGPSYTIETIRYLKKNYPDVEWYFIAGADTILDLSTWKDPEELFKICAFIAVNRPGYGKDLLDRQIHQAKQKYGAEIHVVNAPLLKISSTDIRFRLMTNKPIKYLLPETVEAYIRKNGLYNLAGGVDG